MERRINTPARCDRGLASRRVPDPGRVAVGIAAAVVAILRLPLSAVVLATLLTSHAGPNVEPLIIVGVVVSSVATLVMARMRARAGTAAEQGPRPEPAVSSRG